MGIYQASDEGGADLARGDDALAHELGAPSDASGRELALYLRYAKALALLGECARYVDDAEYCDQIAGMIAEARAQHPALGQLLRPGEDELMKD